VRPGVAPDGLLTDANDSRVVTLTLAALADRGMAATRIASMYGLERVIVDEAVDLERQLAGIGTAA
jgi:hypothetical protein